MLPNVQPYSGRRRQSRNSRTRNQRSRFSAAGHAPLHHIQVAPTHPVNDEGLEEIQVPCLIIPSFQVGKKGIAGQKLTNSSHFSLGPGATATFAEVAAMPRQRRAIGPAHDPKSGIAEHLGSENDSPSTLDPLRLSLKHSKKKARKWSPLDLAAICSPTDSTSPVTTGSSSPILSTVLPYQRSSTTSLQSTQSQVKERTASCGGRISGQQAGFQTDPTNISGPRQRQRSSLLQESSIIHKEDSPEVKEKLQQIMSRFDEAFDIEEWDPDLPSVGINNSPEPLTVRPQPVAYTTVGSLVKTDAAPKFTPPVRLQREGAGRRIPLPPTQPRAINNYSMHNQQLNMPNPIGQNPGSQEQNNLRFPARAHGTYQNPARHPQILPEPEKEKLLPGLSISKPFALDNHQEAMLQTLGVSKPVIRSGHPQLGAYNRPTQKDARELGNHSFGFQELLNEDTTGQASGSQGPLAGLEKMQTLQRLAKFENPAREFAKDRLSEFAVSRNNNVNTAISSPSTHGSPYGFVKHHQTRLQNEFEHSRHGSGQLDYKFKFPPTGREQNPYSSTNPLFLGSNQPLGEHHYPSQPTGNAPDSRPGYPQPLTAGPPGHRQAAQGFNMYQWPSVPETGFSDSESFNNQAYRNNAISPQYENFKHSGQHKEPVYDQIPTNSIPMNPAPISNKVVRDTLSTEEAMKYFPNGFPRGFQQEYVELNTTSTYLGDTVFTQNGHLKPPKTAAQSKQEYEDKLNKQFYMGIHRYDMSGEEHVQELEAREFERTMGYNPLPPIGTPAIGSRPVISVEQVKSMSEAECIVPMLEPLFGTLISYADQGGGLNNRALLSKFTKSPAWCIDDSPQGNNSFYGEDWGPAPKRLGRDPRYQNNYDPNSKTWM